MARHHRQQREATARRPCEPQCFGLWRDRSSQWSLAFDLLSNSLQSFARRLGVSSREPSLTMIISASHQCSQRAYPRTLRSMIAARLKVGMISEISGLLCVKPLGALAALLACLDLSPNTTMVERQRGFAAFTLYRNLMRPTIEIPERYFSAEPVPPVAKPAYLNQRGKYRPRCPRPQQHHRLGSRLSGYRQEKPYRMPIPRCDRSRTHQCVRGLCLPLLLLPFFQLQCRQVSSEG